MTAMSAAWPPITPIIRRCRRAHALDWTGARTVPRIGWEWSLLGLESNAAPTRRAPTSRPTVLVAMGGSDPHGLTLRMAKALAVLDSAYRIRFVIGTGMKDANTVARGLVALKKNYETVEGADDLSIEYASADVALCAFGVTAYELAACGVPAIYLGLTGDHAASASAFADAGMGISLGLADKAPEAEIARTVQWLLNKPAARREMRNTGLSLMDGQGAARIAADLSGAGWPRRGAAQDSFVMPAPKASNRTSRTSRRDSAASSARRPARTAHRSQPIAVHARAVQQFEGAHAGARRQPGHGGGRADHHIQRRQHGAGAVQFVLLVDTFRHDDLAAAHLFQRRDLFGGAVILRAQTRCRAAAQEPGPVLQRRILHGAMARRPCRCASRCR